MPGKRSVAVKWPASSVKTVSAEFAEPRNCTTAPICGAPALLRTNPEIAPGRSAAQTGSESPTTNAQVASLLSFNFAPPPGGMQGVTLLQTLLTDQWSAWKYYRSP